ncbi:hypothetical protein AB0D04_30590 [Streptomyces sp. NPDC048483]|uniref:hypothetical protein n=1 Tax=Streptomyces sp. NPDC048483 TaxID=3154927 RepID=UPI0034263DF3
MDATAVSAQLTGARGLEARDFGRVCDEVSAALVNAGTPPSFEIHSSDFDTDPFFVCADRYWRQRFQSHPSIRTAAECARWITGHVVAECRSAVVEQWSLGFAFINRGSIESTVQLTEVVQEIAGLGEASSDVAFFVALYHAGKLRAGHCFDELHSFLQSSPLAMAAGPHRQRPLFVALQSFAAFGSRALTIEHATDLFHQAWSSTRRTRRVVDICLHGLAFAVPFEAQAEMLRMHAEEAVAAYPHDHMFHFRFATGLHMCGLHDAALRSVDTALVLLTGSASFSHDVMQQLYLAKREAIQEGHLRAQRDAEYLRRWEQQEAANVKLEQTMQMSSIRAVELVAVFTAAIAFAVGSLQVTLTGTMSLRDRLWLLAAQGAGLAVFALLIVGGTWLITRVRHRR